MTEPRRILAVTGASGYIGTRLCAAALEAGWDVLALSRRPPAHTRYRFAFYDLAQPVAPGLLGGATALIHLASDTMTPEPNLQIELNACRRLLSQAQEAGIRLVYVSSQTAAPDSPTAYGCTKWSIEQFVLPTGGIVIRPGMVYGGNEAGLFGRLCALVRRLPILPVLWPAPRVQPIHVDDLIKALLAAADPSSSRAGLFQIADPQPVSFTTFLSAIARDRVRRPRIFLPVPVAVIVPTLKIAARIMKNTRVDLSRVWSLLTLRMMDTAQSTRALGISYRKLADGMHPTGSARRRNLIREGQTLLTYLATGSSCALIGRYVRAIERLDSGAALELNKALHACPPLLFLVEGPRLGRSRDIRLERRLDIALQIAEASVFTEPFMLERPIALPLIAIRLMWQLCLETVARLVRPLVGPILHPGKARPESAPGQ
jgi:nucleoside-diphosphate-sugar epimerase